MALRRLTNSDLDDAPESGFVDAIQDSVNRLVDKASTPDRPQSIDLLKQANVDLFQIDIQVPDPWYAVGASSSPPFENSYSGTVAYMKDYDGTVYLNIASVANGVGATIFHLPTGFRPKDNFSFALYDTTASAVLLGSVLTDGSVQAFTPGVHSVTGYVAFKPSDITPIKQSCFPIMLKTGLKSVSGVTVQRVEDVGNAGSSSQASAGYATSVDFTTATVAGKPQIKINNIMGLPYNRKSRVTLLAIGGSK